MCIPVTHCLQNNHC